jgi:hypothetical protein
MRVEDEVDEGFEVEDGAEVVGGEVTTGFWAVGQRAMAGRLGGATVVVVSP